MSAIFPLGSSWKKAILVQGNLKESLQNLDGVSSFLGSFLSKRDELILLRSFVLHFLGSIRGV